MLKKKWNEYPLVWEENDFYQENKTFGECLGDFIFLGQQVFYSNEVFIHYFLHELTHHFQSRSSFIEDYMENKYYTFYLPVKFNDYSKWNNFLNSFKDAKKYQLYEFDAEFTSIYLSKIISEKNLGKWKTFDFENALTLEENFIYDVYKYLLEYYLDFCNKNNLKQFFYSINCNMTTDTDTNTIFSDKNPNNVNNKSLSQNLINFFENWIYPNKDKIFYDIYRATKFFGLNIEN